MRPAARRSPSLKPFRQLQGKVSLISINALHQLHIFIFFLAVFHVCYSATTMALGRAKVSLEIS